MCSAAAVRWTKRCVKRDRSWFDLGATRRMSKRFHRLYPNRGADVTSQRCSSASGTVPERPLSVQSSPGSPAGRRVERRTRRWRLYGGCSDRAIGSCGRWMRKTARPTLDLIIFSADSRDRPPAPVYNERQKQSGNDWDDGGSATASHYRDRRRSNHDDDQPGSGQRR